MTYDPKKAALYNKLIKQGLSEDAAATQAGIGTNDFGSYAIGDNGELGALIVGTGVRPGVEVVTERNTPTRVNYPQTASGLPAQQPTPKNITYTTTSTETVSGGGSTTITAGLPQSTPQSRAVQPVINAKQAEIDQFIKENPSNFARKRQGLPPLTPEQEALRQAQLNTLEDQRSQLTNQQQGLTTPGRPTVTTIPNTTTTTTTTTFGSSTSNQPVDFLDDPELSRQSEIQIDRTLPPPVTTATRRPSTATAPPDDPNAGEAEARAFLQQNARVEQPQADTGFTYYGAVPAAPIGPPQSTATENPNPWAGVNAEKAAAWAQLSPADQRWLGTADPTDTFILKRAPNGGTPQAAIAAPRNRTPQQVDPFAFDEGSLAQPDPFAFDETALADPEPGFTYYGAAPAAPIGPPRSTATANPNPWAGSDAEKAAAWARLSPEDQRWLGTGDPTDPFILRRAPNGGTPQTAIAAPRNDTPTPLPDDNLAFEPLPDDNLAFTQGTDPGAGYGVTFDEFGNEIPRVPPTLPDDNLAYTQGINDTSGYSFEDTGGVPTQTLADFPVQDTTGYRFEDTGGVPTQTLSDFPVSDTAGYGFEDTGGVPTQTLSDFPVDNTAGYPVADDGLAFSDLPDDNLAFPDPVDPGPEYPVADDGLAFSDLPDDDLAFQPEPVDDTEGYIVADGTINVPDSQVEFAPTALGGNFSAQYDVESGTYGVFDEDTGQFVQTGLTEQEATILAQDASIGDPNFAGNPDAASDTGAVEGADIPPSDIAFEPTALGGDFSAAFDPETGTWGVFDNEAGVFVETGLTEQQAILKAQEYSVGDPNFAGNADAATDPGLTPEQAQAQAAAQRASEEAQAAAALAQRLKAQAQAAIEAQRKQAAEGDWRVKIRLAGGADYLYRDPNINQDGILYPLKVTDGVIFPYTPTISTNYAANYSTYDLTHSNYRGYFYQNSYVDEITIQAQFTAQDTTEANYVLAVIHFFRSVTKMFYGQDPNRGQPPPLVFLQGLGEFQFNLHPCVVRSFVYNMPADVDYIRARSPNINGTTLLDRRALASQDLPDFNASNQRLSTAQPGGLPAGASSPQISVPILGTKSPTYVPTKFETTITLLPIQTRQQVSQEFSLRSFANGELVKKGFW